MKKLLFLFLFFPLFSISQNYIGQSYSHFLERMLSLQNDNGKEIVISKKYYNDNKDSDYLITVVWDNGTTFLTTTYTFDKKDTCVYIYQFLPIDEQKVLDEVMNELKGVCDENYRKIDDYWIEYDGNMTIKYTIEEKIISNKKGISIIIQKL